MSYLRHAKQTDTNQSEIVDGLRAAGCTVSIIGRPVDLLVGRDGLNYLLEVKSPKGPTEVTPSRRSDEQRDFYEKWAGHVREVTSLAQALEVVGVGE